MRFSTREGIRETKPQGPNCPHFCASWGRGRIASFIVLCHGNPNGSVSMRLADTRGTLRRILAKRNRIQSTIVLWLIVSLLTGVSLRIRYGGHFRGRADDPRSVATAPRPAWRGHGGRVVRHRGAVPCGRLADDVWSFMVARFIGGLGVGIQTVAAPLSIAEISPHSRPQVSRSAMISTSVISLDEA